jgi:hypothetical protein
LTGRKIRSNLQTVVHIQEKEMKVKTNELQGNALDLAVAKAEGREVEVGDHPTESGFTALFFKDSDERCNYTDDWAQGGPIIEREGISLNRVTDALWDATIMGEWTEDGPTPLIAAMRCYAGSKLGNEIEVPDACA